MPKTNGEQLEALVAAFSIKSLPRSAAEISGDIPYEALEPHRTAALRELALQMELPGFRKGHVPEPMALQKIGEMGLLEEAVEYLMREFYPALIAEKKIDAVGRPSIRITKLVPGQPVSLVIETAVYPAILIPENFRELTARIPATAPEPVTESEFSKALEQLQQSRATKSEGGAEQIPELNDEFAKSIGTFQSLEDLKAKLREGIAQEKAREARDKRRSAIIEALLQKISIDMPELFIESEVERMLSQMRADAARFGLEFNEYLKRIDKTEELLRTELRLPAEKRAKLQLVLNKIAQQEKIKASQEEIDREFQHALAHYADADQEALRTHVESILRNEKVLQMLEAKTE